MHLRIKLLICIHTCFNPYAHTLTFIDISSPLHVTHQHGYSLLAFSSPQQNALLKNCTVAHGVIVSFSVHQNYPRCRNPDMHRVTKADIDAHFEFCGLDRSPAGQPAKCESCLGFFVSLPWPSKTQR